MSSRIYSNLSLGSDLAAQGDTRYVTPNDSGDADTGPNRLQNFPVLTSISRGEADVRLVGSLHSAANGSYRIEFFGSEVVHPSGHGEGQFYLGATDVTTDSSGNAAFDVTLPAPAAAHSFTTTATDAQGNTSEFSNGQAQMQNISTRLNVQTGEDVLIAGFIITGRVEKRVILRAIGPSLMADAQPLPDRLEDPVLELVDSTGATIGSSDDWQDEDESGDVFATSIPPTHERESAIVRSLAPGAYTAIMRGKDQTTGIGLVEVYDLDQRTGSRLANISSRGFVAGGDSVMIGGFIIGPEPAEKTNLLIRALGPSLRQGGVARALPDPVADVRDASGSLVASNDDWKENEAAVVASGLQPADEREAVVMAALAPGNYTVIVTGKGDAQGVGLVELYNLQ